MVTITQQPARAKRARRRRARHGGKRRRTRLVARSAARRGRVPRAPKVNTTDYVLMYRPATARADVGSPLVRTRYADGRSGKLRVGVKFLRLASIDREGMFLPRKVCRLLSRKGLTYGVETQLGRVLRSVAAPTDVFRGRIALRRPDQALAIESLGFGCGKLAGTGVKDMLDDARRNGSVLEAPPPSVVNVPGRVIGGLTEIPPNGGSGGPGGSGNGGGSGGGGGGGDDGGGDSGGGGDPPPPPPPPPAECPDGENPDCPAPANTAAPSISPGSAGLGTALSCSQGSWSNEPTSFAYQWYRNGSGISGATSSSYTTQSADYNQPLTCKVTASNAGGSTLSPASNTVTPTWNQGGGGGGGGGGCGYQYLSRSSTRVCLVT